MSQFSDIPAFRLAILFDAMNTYLLRVGNEPGTKDLYKAGCALRKDLAATIRQVMNVEGCPDAESVEDWAEGVIESLV